MFARTPQPGLWFIAGSLAQCRIYSKYLALQIKASELGLLPRGGEARGRSTPWEPQVRRHVHRRGIRLDLPRGARHSFSSV